MNIDQILPGRGAPMAEQARLDVLGAQRLAQQWIFFQVDLTDSQVVGSAPVGVDELKITGRKRVRHDENPRRKNRVASDLRLRRSYLRRIRLGSGSIPGI